MLPMVRWAVRNSPSMNTLMIAVLTLGVSSMYLLRREIFPAFELEIVLTSVPYPGASPSEVEEGICMKIEEAVRSLDGIRKITSVAQEGGGFVICELDSDVEDPQRVLNDIRSAVDRIPSFPENAEDANIQQIVIRNPAIRVSVVSRFDVDAVLEDSPKYNPHAEWELRSVAEQVREQLLQLRDVSQVDIVGEKPFQIDVEIPEATLRKYGLTLRDVAETLRRENVELPAGTIKTRSHEYLVRGQNKGQFGHEIARLPVLTAPGGVVLTAGDLGEVRDGFEDAPRWSSIDGKLALTLQVNKTEDEDLLAIVEQVRDFVEQRADEMPEGYRLAVWSDMSVAVRDRLNMLTKNGIGGLILVFLVLSVFLDIRLAFWVALGIPVSVMGAATFMWGTGETLNMLTMFAFIMALGIVVDDAIVIGENVYKHRERGESRISAAVVGTSEVAPAVMASVATTIIAFLPLAFVSGMMGKFIGVMPPVVIAMLVVSLVESMLILPCHLAHSKSSERGWHFRLRTRVEAVVERVVQGYYLPTLRWGLRYPLMVLSIAIASMLLSIGLIQGGFTPLEIFPKIDGDVIYCQVAFPEGTPVQMTDSATRALDAAVRRVEAEVLKEAGRDDVQLLTIVHRSVGKLTQTQQGVSGLTGGHVGEVWVELTPVEIREQWSDGLSTRDIIARWREAAGEFPGADEVSFGGQQIAPNPKSIEFKLVGNDSNRLLAAAEDAKQRLSSYRSTMGVYDEAHDKRPGKWELQMKIRPKAESLGIQLSDLARTVRSAYYGEEVMRLQRGRHEVKLMVRYPPEERRSLANFEEIRVRTPEGDEIPLPELAQVDLVPSFSEINRVNQQRSITVTADVDEEKGNPREIVARLKKEYFETEEYNKKFPGVSVRWEGQQEQWEESMYSLAVGFAVAFFAMFVLLTVEFRSYVQPAIILLTIPFGLVGAVLGHLVLGLSLTLFSMFGLVALAGVIANDSIVLIDFINRCRREGMPLRDALMVAGSHRFRPVMLTSITTVAGLLPILLEGSLQAQVLIPMAASLAFGLVAATAWVLVLVAGAVPVLRPLRAAARIAARAGRGRLGNSHPWRAHGSRQVIPAVLPATAGCVAECFRPVALVQRHRTIRGSQTAGPRCGS